MRRRLEPNSSTAAGWPYGFTLVQAVYLRLLAKLVMLD